jgi:predicted O-linked N-acetylglucosamine transferase (SPINDLY family)
MNGAAPATAARVAGGRHWHVGLARADRADWTGAARAFARAVRAAPADMLYRINLANAYRHAGDPAGEVREAERVLAIDPAHPLALRLLGDGLVAQHRYEEAAAAYERLEAAGVREPDAMLQHGAMLQALRRPLQAIGVLMRAAAVDPRTAMLHALMATAFRDMAMQVEAVECLKTVLALDPGNLQVLSHLSYEKRHLCDWDGLDRDLAEITGLLESAVPGTARVAGAFSLLSLPLDPALQLAAARGESLAAAIGARELPAVNAAARAGAKPRLAMLSYDFREHPVSQLVVEVLELVDRTRFDLVLYSIGPDDGSALRRRVAAAADAFVDLRGMSDADAALRIRADGIDVLIDLQGQTRGHRMGILARRPAPVQVAFLGYPGSTGAPFIDYLIGDPVVTPLALGSLYSEKLAQMPRTFQPNGRWRPLPQPMTRSAAGLPDDAFVMCAFNHTYKILPEAFDAWCGVMREVPHAVLWLKETNAQLHGHVRRQARERGVAPERVLFAKAAPYAEHFSRLALADLFVDTWPYNAHTTAADALWAGVPVVTVYGNGFASRVAASVLDAAGIGELAFETVEAYRLAITAFALEPGLLARYREHLHTQRMALPLFDSDRYTREFEQLLSQMVERQRAGLPPAHLPAHRPVPPPADPSGPTATPLPADSDRATVEPGVPA